MGFAAQLAYSAAPNIYPSVPLPGLLAAIMEGKIDTTFLISHRMALEDAPKGYKMFHDEQNTTTKIVLKPDMAAAA